MKFKRGLWLMQKDIKPLYAVEAYRVRETENAIEVLVATAHIANRGATMSPALSLRLFSPAEGVIGVEAVHFAGTVDRGPHYHLNAGDSCAQIIRREGEIVLKSGAMEARLSTVPGAWSLRFFDGDKYLTGSGFRAMGHMTNEVTGQTWMTEQLDLSVGESVYGFGERFTAFVKNGQLVEMWNGDGGTSSELAYKNIPFYMSSRGYGVMVDDTGDTAFEVASENVERVEFAVKGEKLTYFVFAGPTPHDVLRRYTGLTGRPALPPAWSFGLWLSTSFTTNYDEATTSSFIEGMRSRGIPLHVFHFDCFWMKGYNWCDFTWDDETFPDPEGMLARYKATGLKICVWINPYIAQNSPLFAEAAKAGYLIRKKDGSVWQTDMWQAGMGIVDFTNPDARTWYREHLRPLLEMGVDCFKTDFGERIPVKDVEYFDHSDSMRMHNYYTHLYNEAVFSLLEEVKGKGQAIVFARSATVGGQCFPVHWGGDNSATYVSMAETLRAGLSLASCGFGFWSHDISGFESTAPAHVYKRWCQFGLLSSHSRLHGSQSYRVPWLFDEEACVVLKKFAELKCTLMPYLYRMAVIAHEEGIPMLRPMYMEFPGDPACETLDRQYMLGESLLVAPVFDESGEVQYYLPDGEWTHLLDGRRMTGGRWVKEKYDFMSLPLWVKENTLLPVGKSSDQVEYDYADGVEMRAYCVTRPAEIAVPGPDGSTQAVFRAEVKDGKVVVTSDSAKPWTQKIIG